jgi:hypothetical protein
MKTNLALIVETDEGRPEDVKRLVEDALDWIQSTGFYREASDFNEFDVTKLVIVPTSIIEMAMEYQ